MLPVGVQVPVLGSYNSAVAIASALRAAIRQNTPSRSSVKTESAAARHFSVGIFPTRGPNAVAQGAGNTASFRVASSMHSRDSGRRGKRLFVAQRLVGIHRRGAQRSEERRVGAEC